MEVHRFPNVSLPILLLLLMNLIIHHFKLIDLFIYSFIYSFCPPPPPPPPATSTAYVGALVGHLITTLTKFQKNHCRCSYVMNICISYLPMIVLLWLLLLLVVISLFILFFSCIIFLKFPFLLVVVFLLLLLLLLFFFFFDVVELAYWFCFYFKTCSSRHILYLRCYW